MITKVKDIKEIADLDIGEPFEFGSYFNYSQDRIIIDQSILWVKVSEETALTVAVIEIAQLHTLDHALSPIALHAGLPMKYLTYPTAQALENLYKILKKDCVVGLNNTAWVNRRCLVSNIWMLNNLNKMEAIVMNHGQIHNNTHPNCFHETAGVMLMLKLTE